MDASTKLLSPDAARAAFEIVEKAIQSIRPRRALTPVEALAEKATAIFLFCVGFGFGLLLFLAAFHNFWPSRSLAILALGVAVGTEISSLLSLLTLIAQVIPYLNRIRKNPAQPIIELTRTDIDRLMPYCNDLMHCSLPVLSYIREHIVYQRDAFDNRRGRLVGQLDKIGALPALATIGVSVVKLVQDSHIVMRSSMIWTAAASLAAFYLFSLVFADTSDKFTHAAAMLNFVIDHHPETKGNESP
ncbi:hypothetical protein DIE18_13640 [Burkholderia sp. Bp9125]|nr:hypothetical protein DIE18_13640 [Burkholderia sp. Bp9125]